MRSFKNTSLACYFFIHVKDEDSRRAPCLCEYSTNASLDKQCTNFIALLIGRFFK